jgi:predicted nuclease of predicted toxin-antitoxin system
MNPADKEIPDSELRKLFGDEIAYHETVAYYLDENLPVDIAALLREKGIRVTTAYDEDQAGEEADTYLLARARALTCVMVTYDWDLEDIHRRIKGLKGLTHAGLIIVKRRGNRDYSAQLVARLCRMADKYEGWADWLHGQLIYL